MKWTKKEKAEFLFEEIGSVDDRLLAEAMSYRAERYRWVRPLSAVAAILVAALIGSSALFGGFRSLLQGVGGNQAEDGVNEAVNNRLDTFFQDLRTNTSDSLALFSTPSVSFFDDAHLVWQYENDPLYYRSRALEATEVEKLLSLIEKGDPVGADAPALTCRVWLVTGDGDVYSPYLPTTPGNRGAALLFDYEAELLPSEALLSCISDILNQ